MSQRVDDSKSGQCHCSQVSGVWIALVSSKGREGRKGSSRTQGVRETGNKGVKEVDMEAQW